MCRKVVSALAALRMGSLFCGNSQPGGWLADQPEFIYFFANFRITNFRITHKSNTTAANIP